MAAARLKLITIVAETILEERLSRELLSLGATGFTASETRGRGSRGIRTGSIPGESIRIEVIVSETVAGKIVSHLSEHYFPHYAVIAWTTDVDVVRGEKYVR